MGGSVGAVLTVYVYPLFGLSLLALGAWCSWAVWLPGAALGFLAPSLAARVAALILGGVWGWFLTNLEYSWDALHVTVGFPLPVMTSARLSGHRVEWGAGISIPCLLLNLVIGVGMANTMLYLIRRTRASHRARQGRRRW